MKYLNLNTPNGLTDSKAVGTAAAKKGGAFVQISEIQSANKEKTEHRVPLNASEIKQLTALLRVAIPLAYGWL
jgi:hypothetical protein